MSKKKSIALLIAVFVLCGMFFCIYKNWEDFKTLQNLPYRFIWALAFVAFFFIAVQGEILRTVLVPFNVKLSPIESFALLIITLLGNYLLPLSGIGFRVGYLKNRYNLAFSDFALTLGAIAVTEILVFAIGGLIGLGFIFKAYQIFNLPLILLFFGLVLISILVISVLPRTSSLLSLVPKKLKQLTDGWVRIHRNRTIVLRLIFLSSLEFLLFSLMFFLTFKGLNLNVPFLSSFVVSTLVDLSFFIRVAPAGLGTYEASVLYGSSLYGLTITQGLMVIIVTRVATMFWSLFLGPIFLLTIFSSSKIKLNEA